MRLASRICFVLICVIFIEASYFSYILTHQNSRVRSDAIIILSGAEKRIQTGYELANQGTAPVIIISSAADTYRRYHDSKYALKDTVTQIPESQATTTFENALYTSRIILAKGYQSVILVTSDYHMPRGHALLKLFLLGKGVRVHRHMVHGAADAMTVNASFLKLVYNEMVEFWGSLYEYASYQARGLPTEKPVKQSALSALLKSLVLLDVERLW